GLVGRLVVFSNSATAPATTTTSVGSSVSASVFGQSVTFTATISIGDPGTVQFQIDGSDAGSPVSVSTSDGVTTASFSIASLAVGSHTVTASYSGDDSFAGSSGTLAGGQTVDQAGTSTLLVSSANPSLFGQA